MIRDFEDALIEQAALLAGCEAILTRNTRDFRASSVPAYVPEAYLKGLEKK